jgi:hypothetical protein
MLLKKIKQSKKHGRAKIAGGGPLIHVNAQIKQSTKHGRAKIAGEGFLS